MKKLLPLLFFALTFLAHQLVAQPGTIDLSFDIGTGFNDRVEAIALQSDGKILVGGDFTSYNGITANRIIRLNSDGSIDNTFNAGTGFDGGVSGITIHAGKILVIGCWDNFNGATHARILRLNSDGSLDNTFDPGTGFDGCVYALATQADGKIVVVGQITSYDGNAIGSIVRIDNDGSYDNTFVQGTGFNNYAHSVIVQPDGKIIVGGNSTSYNGTTLNHICRLNSDGSLDNTFGTTGSGFNGSVFSILLRPDNKLFVGGGFTTYDNTSVGRMVLLNSDGSLDNTFATAFDSYVWRVAIQPDDKIVTVGSYSAYNGNSQNRVAVLNTNGSLDNTFVIGTGFNATTRALALQPDGKILVGGWFDDYNGTPKNYIVRLNGDLTIAVEENNQNALKIWTDGNRIIVDATALIESSMMDMFSMEGKHLLHQTIEAGKITHIDNSNIAESIVAVSVYNDHYSQTQKLIINK